MITREGLANLQRNYARRYDKSPNEVRLNASHLADIMRFVRVETGEDLYSTRVTKSLAEIPIMGMQFTVTPEAKRVSVRYNKKIKKSYMYDKVRLRG